MPAFATMPVTTCAIDAIVTCSAGKPKNSTLAAERMADMNNASFRCDSAAQSRVK